jgi:predicted nucleotidyltransferase
MLSNLLPLTENKLKILSCIYTYNRVHNSEISRLVKIKPQNVLKIIKELREKEVLESRTIGKSIEYTLSNKYLKYVGLFEEIRKEQLLKSSFVLKKVYNEFFRIKDKLDAVYLIGSYVRGTQTKKSDMDLIIITDKKLSFKELERKILLLEKIKLHLQIFTNKQYEEEIESDSIFYNTTLKYKKDRVILYEK